MMNLLSIRDSRAKRDVENSTKELRSNELDALLSKKHKELAGLEATIAERLEWCRLQNDKEAAEHQRTIEPLRKEVLSLEERKKQALLPLHEKEKELEDRNAVLSQREERVSIKETELDSKLEQVEIRFDDLKEVSRVQAERSRSLDRREEGVKAQERLTTERSNKLTEVLESGYASLKTAASNIEVQRTELKGRETVLSEKERRILEKEKDLLSRERALVDKYRTLERATKEMNLKNGKRITRQ